LYLKDEFEKHNIDFYVKERAKMVRKLKMFKNVLPTFIHKSIKKLYMFYLYKKTDDNDFMSANKAINAKNFTSKELNRQFSKWLLSKLCSIENL